METWAVEVKSGESFKVNVEGKFYCRISQASIGEIEKEKNKSLYLYITINGKKHVLGTLHPKRLPQQRFDLLFADNFEISHNWKHGSVNFYGSATDISVFPDDTIPYDDTSSDNDTSSDDDEDNNDSSHEEEATIKKVTVCKE
ncbi:hypothetical protein Lser_V15G19253 [Lactuca serriola]